MTERPVSVRDGRYRQHEDDVPRAVVEHGQRILDQGHDWTMVSHEGVLWLVLVQYDAGRPEALVYSRVVREVVL